MKTNVHLSDQSASGIITDTARLRATIEGLRESGPIPATDLYTHVVELPLQPLHVSPEPVRHFVHRPKQPVSDDGEVLRRLKEKEARLKERACAEVVFSPSLISRQGVGIVGRGTLNVVQGRHGSHKSRIAETLSALLLSTNPIPARNLDFERGTDEPITVCYIDTERNNTEELPKAIQNIKLKAGYSLGETPDNFRFTSIKDNPRSQRLLAIRLFIQELRRSTTDHLFVVLDVVTDCVGSFNDDKEAMELFDFAGRLCEEFNSTFLLVIHENPGSEKARGHVGTEAINKASTVIQIGYENENNDLIRLKFLKLRHGKKPAQIYLKYDDTEKGLVLAQDDDVAQHLDNRKQKAGTDEIRQELGCLLAEGPLSHSAIIKELMDRFSASDRTVRDRLSEVEKQPLIICPDGFKASLLKYRQDRHMYYKLEPIASK
ncbi:AAA family ATPase [Tellurirhabdus rosea]|uniref:AAA family ATPase n=1 Tax=Tellurirhabdus rosea TaxID=2674997 RepID=UPI0022582B5E|nr:AAA family ATPase [Tellurirhabdus rosea]